MGARLDERTYEPGELRATVAPHAALYLRLSQDRDGTNLGIERQEEACRALADSLGYEIAEVISDNDTSAFSGKARPGYERLLSLIETGSIDAVVAYHSDRLYRRTTDLERLVTLLESHSTVVKTVAAGEVDLASASGRMVARMLGAVAQHESERIAERVRLKQSQSARQGRAAGARFAPYGYRRNRPGELEIDSVQAAVVAEMAERALRGEPLDAIARDLVSRNVLTSAGSPTWTGSGIKAILTSGTIAGLRTDRGDVVAEATWQPIVGREVHERLRALLATKKRGVVATRYLLSGMLRCGSCGRQLHSHSGRSTSSGRLQRSYACLSGYRHQGCGGVTISATSVESFLVGLTLEALAGADLTEVTRRRSTDETSRLSEIIERDEELLRTLADDFGQRLITRQEWLAARQPIDERLKDARRRITQVAPTPTLPGDLLAVDEETWETLDFDVQRQLVALVFHPTIEIKKATTRGRRFNPSRIDVTKAYRS